MHNIVALVGRLTKNPEIRDLPDGTQLANFSLAVNTGKEETSFFDCIAFRTNAEVMSKFTKKGDLLAVSGMLRQRKWKGKDGKDQSKVEIVVSSISLLTPKQEEPKAPNPADFPFNPEEEARDELPAGWHYDKSGKPVKDATKKK